MNMIERLLRRNGRRIKHGIAPVMLALGLAGFALAQMPYASTLWSEDLKLNGSVGIATSTPTPTPVPPTATPTNTPGTSTCTPVVTLVSSTYDSLTNRTTYVYNVVRGGTPGNDCQTVSYFAFNVCFNPELGGGTVLAESHSPDYTYDPSNGQGLVKWNNANDGVPPNNLISPLNVTFSVTVAGNVAPVTTTWKLHAGSNSTVTGQIQGPGPSSCGTLTNANSLPIGGNGTSPNACLPLVLASNKVTEENGKTTYSYKLTGGSASGKAGCPDVQAVILPVCFNPALDPAGWVLSAPSLRDWRYSGQMEDTKATPAIPRSVSWLRIGGRGPWNTTLIFDAPGTGVPVEKVHAIGRDVNGTDYDLGEVEVPKPAACNALPPPPVSGDIKPQPTSTVVVPGNTPVPTSTPEPTMVPRPGTTPDRGGSNRATPTPELIGGVVWE